MKTHPMICFLLISLLSSLVAQAAEDPPLSSELTERVEVRIVQVDVDIIPKDKSKAREVCAHIAPEQILLEVGGTPRKIIDLYPLTTEGQASNSQPGQAKPQGRLIVFVLDEIAMGPFCPPQMRALIRMLCFDAIRKFLNTGFKPGDQVRLASIDFTATLHSRWFTTRESALEGLAQIEKDAELSQQGLQAFEQVMNNRNLDDWWRAWADLIASLGNYSGRKDVFLLGLGAFPPISASDGSGLNYIGALCQLNRVRIHAVRIGEHLLLPKIVPFPIQSFALASGGTSWVHLLDPHIVVTYMEEAEPCRFVLSFIPETTDDREKLAQLRLYSRDERFRVHAPESFLTRANMPTKEQQRENLYTAGEVVRGLAVTAQLIPFSIDSGGNKWRSALRVRVHVAGETKEKEEEMNQPLMLELSFWQGTKVLAEFIQTVPEAVVEEIKGKGEGEFVRTLDLPPGEVHFGVAVYQQSLETFGSTRGFFDFPKLPCQEGNFWWLSDKLVQVDGKKVPLPALDDDLSLGRLWVAGVNCSEKSLPLGKLVDPMGEVIEVPLERLVDPNSRTLENELWIGSVPPGRAPGTWRFTPPDAPQKELVFKIAAQSSESPRQEGSFSNTAPPPATEK